MGAVEEEDALQVDLLPHHLGPALQVVLIARKAINEEIILLTVIHGPLQQRAGDLHRDYGAIGYVVFYQFSILRPRTSSFSPEEITSRQVHMAKLLNNPRKYRH